LALGASGALSRAPMIPTERPEVVIAAIEEVLAQARAG
jgi:hypothetical protein